MPDSPLGRTIGRLLRGGETRPLVCLAASIGLGALAVGAGLAGGWLYGTTWRPSGPGRIGDVVDRDIATGLIAGGAAWLVLLVLVWRRALRLRGDLGDRGLRVRMARLTILTLVIGGVTAALGVTADMFWHRLDERELLITAFALLAGGFVILLWMPLVDECVYGRAQVGGRSDLILTCPRCDHSMVGLRRPVCPECGQEYTLDELFAAQERREKTADADASGA